MLEQLFNRDEEELIFRLAEKLTGACQQGKMRRSILVQNVSREMLRCKADSLRHYLQLVSESAEEHANLVSALTIHTTSWFRESPHYKALESYLTSESPKMLKRTFNLYCSACSSGPEAYSFALLLESLRIKYPGFDYRVTGTDIDPVSVGKAKSAIYQKSDVNQIPEAYRKFLLSGTGKTSKYFTLDKNIRERCTFFTQDLKKPKLDNAVRYDYIVCRNVLIYFTPEDVKLIIQGLIAQLASEGRLVLGHSEAIDPKSYNLQSLGNTTYIKLTHEKAAEQEQLNTTPRRRALVIDDSPTIRQSIIKLLEAGDFKVVGVPSADEATDFLKNNQVDIVTLDLHMPGTSGQTWLRMQRSQGFRVPVVVVSGASPEEAVEVLGALENGAQDYIDKGALQRDKDDVVARIKAITDAYTNTTPSTPVVKNKRQKLELKRPDVILLGASTGGTEALSLMLKHMPTNVPPVLAVQHISPSFCKPFAERLASVSGLKCGAPLNGAKLEPNTIYLAHGDYHIGIKQTGSELYLTVSDSPHVNRHRPAVDFLFQAGSLITKKNIFAALLTGMGYDGAKGLLELANRGAITAAQDEESSVVFGMPKEAIRLGAAKFIGSPTEIREQLNQALKK